MQQEDTIELPKLTTYVRYLRSTAPRTIPGFVKIEMLFGGWLNQLAWYLIAFGAIFFWLFAINSDVSPLIFWIGKCSVSGQVIKNNATGIGKDDIPKTPVTSYVYTYKDHTGKKHRGVSYGSLSNSQRIVTVEYLNIKPDISRIQGLRMGSCSLDGLLSSFPVILGLLAIIACLPKQIRRLQLLQKSEMIDAKLKCKSPTGVEINGSPQYKAIYTFQTANGRIHDTILYVHNDEKLHEGAIVIILSNPKQPSSCIMLDEIRGFSGFNSTGDICVDTYGIKLLLLPFVAVLGHTLGALLRWVI